MRLEREFLHAAGNGDVAHMKAVILLAGYATRMWPLTCYMNKGMIPLAGRPLLEYILIKLRDQGFCDFLIAMTAFPEQLQHYFGDGSRFGVNIQYFARPEPSQTAGEIAAMRDLLADEDNFLVHYGDIITNLDAAAMAEKHIASHAAATIGLVSGIPFHGGVAELDDEENLVEFVEKPQIDTPTHAAVDVFSSAVFNYCAPGLDFGNDVIPTMMHAGERVIGFLDDDAYWHDVGRLSDIENVAKFLGELGRIW